jgi:hypothetical protein
MNLPIMDGNFNKNYRLPLERSYGRRILENHDFRKESSFSQNLADQNSNLKLSPTYLQYQVDLGVDDYYLKCA